MMQHTSRKNGLGKTGLPVPILGTKTGLTGPNSVSQNWSGWTTFGNQNWSISVWPYEPIQQDDSSHQRVTRPCQAHKSITEETTNQCEQVIKA